MNSTKQASELIRLSLNELKNNNFAESLAYAEQALLINPKDFRALQIRPLCKCCILVERQTVDPLVQSQLQDIISDLKESINCSDEIAGKLRNIFDAII